MVRHRRIANWHVPLERVIRQHDGLPFEYGTHDCCTFSNACIKELIGIDMMDVHRDYDSEKAGLRKIVKAGGLEKLVEAEAEKHGLMEVGVSYAQRGDLVLLNHLETVNCGILWQQGQVACAAAGGGVALLPVELGFRAWRVA